MPNVNFYLKKADPKGRSLIFLQFKYSGYRLVYSFGQTIHAKDWSLAKQRLKSTRAITADGEHSLNDLLDNLEGVCKNAYNKEIAKGVPQPETLKRYLVGFMNQNQVPENTVTLFSLIERFVSGEIKYRGRDKKADTLKPYTTTYNHLKAFAIKERYPVDFETITLDFYYKFVSYLKKKGLAPNTIGRNIKDVKTFMSEAVDMDYTSNYQFRNKKFMVIREETDSIYLTESEIEKLHKHDFSKHSKLDSTRDMFVAACWLGLRYSDLSNIKPENIKNIDGDTFVQMKTQKTGELVVIPCHPTVLKIFDKYSTNFNRLPRAISNQKYNNYIKEACRAAGLTETARLILQPDLALWQLVSSHTARRSFATNYYLQGFPTLDLMKITGHRTESSFMKYIKVSKLDTAKRLSEHIKMNWSKKLLKVAS
jgi:integrase